MKISRKWKRLWHRDKPSLLQSVVKPAAVAVALTATILLGSPSAYALPTDGTVTVGAGIIAKSGSNMTVTQQTDKLAVNWQSFNIAAGEKVQFVQPNAQAVALNRVIGNNASAIYGQLSANGRVILINPNGVYFSPTARIDTGALVASALNISDSDFAAGKYRFTKGGGAGSVRNEGTITAADGGYVALLGESAVNEGVIIASKGTVALASGEKATLDMTGDGLINLAVDQGALNAQAANKGLIQADGGLVLMTARSAGTLAGTVVNNSGTIRANALSVQNGRIILDGGNAGAVSTGTLDASGLAAGQTGGTVKVLGDTVTLGTGSHINVAGDSGGGTVLVGGNYQGKGPEQNAANATVEAGTTITADAVTTGKGGTVVVWADGTTKFAGTISAKGGSQSGDGGLVETSGKESLNITAGANVTAGANNGKAGLWLLDPYNYSIGATEAGYIQTTLGSTDVAITTANATATVNGNTISGTSGDGDINVNSAITWSANKLTLTAANNINIKATMDASNTASLDLTTGANGKVLVAFKPATSDNQALGHSYDGFKGKVNFAGSATLSINGLPYTIIYDLAGLQAMQNNLSGKYALGSDITNPGATLFTPIGASGNYSTTAFSGVFNGLGHTIDGLKITNTVSSNNEGIGTGLFGGVGHPETKTGAVSNVGLTNVDITMQLNINGYSQSWGYYIYDVGALAGRLNGTVDNSYVAGGSVKFNSTVDNNQAQGNGGGLVGINFGTIKNSYSNVAVSASKMVNTNIGGLVGLIENGTVGYSYALGSVSVPGSQVGGFAGGIYAWSGTARIYDSYSNVAVTASGTTDYVILGGFVGQTANNSTIERSYSIGRVTDSAKGTYGEYVGGFVGQKAAGTITDSYWDSGTTGQLKGDYTGSNPGLTDKSGSTLTTTFSNWNTTEIWNFKDGRYPVFVPTITVYLFADNKTVQYGDAAPTYSFTLKDKATGGNTLSGTDYFTGGTLPSVTSSYTQGANAGQTFTISTTNWSSLTAAEGYSLGTASTGTLTVAARELTVTGTTVTGKTYDGNTTATVSAAGTLVNLYNNETLTLSASGAFKNKNAGENKDVDITYTLSKGGSDTGILDNYTVQQGTATATIDKKTVTLSASKTYDGTKNLTDKVTIQTGVGTGDKVETLTYTNATANDANVATANNYVKTITLTDGTGENGGLASNYQPPTLDSANAPVTITAKTVTLSASKNYDGTTDLTEKVTIQTGVGTGAQAQTLTYTNATASDAHVASTKKYINTINLGDGTGTYGGLSSNYQLPTLDSTNAPVTITAATLTPTLTNSNVTTVTKVYDGSKDAPTGFSPDWSFSGLVAGDTAAALTSTKTEYNSKDVLTANKITVSGLSITGITGSKGSLASDYVLDATSKDVAATVTKKTVTLSASKTYDGTTNLTGKVTIQTGVGSETLNYTGATTNDAHVVTANKYISVITLANGTGDNGGLSSNYQLPTLNSTNAPVTITAATLTPTLTNSNVTTVTKVYDGSKDAPTGFSPDWSFSGLVAGDTAAALTSTKTEYNSKDVLTANKITVSGLSITGITGSKGSLASDYVLDATSKDVAATVTKKTVTLSASKVYDSKENLTGTDVTITTGVGSETLNYTGATASNVNVATANKYISAITLTDGTDGKGGLASNYQNPILNPANAPLTINPKALTITGTTAKDKVFDGNDKADVTKGTLSGFVDPETVAVDTVVGTFATKNPGSQNVTVKYTLKDGEGNNGGLASNYSLDDTIITAKILPATEPNAAVETAKKSPENQGPVTVIPPTNPADNGSGLPPNVDVVNSGIATPPSSPPGAPPTLPTPPQFAPTTAGQLSLASVGNQSGGFSLAVSGQTVTITMPSSPTGTDPIPPVEATNVPVLTVAPQTQPALVDAYNISANSSSLNVTSSGKANDNRPEMPTETTPGAKTEPFKLGKADGSQAEFSVTYADGAISIKPLNAAAAELCADTGTGLKALAATGMVTVQQNLGIGANTITAVYVNKQ